MSFTNYGIKLFLSNRVAGTAGAIVTCPLEVVKTRLQSSNPVFGNPVPPLSGPYHPRSGGSSSSSYSSGSRGHGHGTGTGLSGYNRTRGYSKPRLFSTCVNCGRNSHILAVARGQANVPMPASNAPKIGLVECLR